MTTAAKLNFANSIELAPSPAGTLVVIAELLSLEPPKRSRDTIDVTTHDSTGGAMEYIVEGIYDTGELKGQCHYVSGSTFDLAAITALTSGAKQDVKIKVKAATGNRMQTFSAFLTEYGADGMDVKGKQTAAFTLKVTGVITEAVYA